MVGLVDSPAGEVLGLVVGGGGAAAALAGGGVLASVLRPVLLQLPGARPGLLHDHPPPSRLDLPGAAALTLARVRADRNGARHSPARAPRDRARPELGRLVRLLAPGLAVALAIAGIATALRARPATAGGTGPARDAGAAVHASVEERARSGR
jgi:hypothetical protein